MRIGVRTDGVGLLPRQTGITEKAALKNILFLIGIQHYYRSAIQRHGLSGTESVGYPVF